MAKQKILIVDDDNDILTLNRDFLIGEGYEVSTATSCAEALDKVQLHNFGCLVLDVMLPDGSAFDLAPKLKQYTDSPIIFLTAKDQQEDVIKGFNVGLRITDHEPYRAVFGRAGGQHGLGRDVLLVEDVRNAR